MVLITFMTFDLISSSAVMAMAVGAARAGDAESGRRNIWAHDFGRRDLPRLPGL